MGNIWQTPLVTMVPGYTPQAHPIVGPLLRGGPAQLIREYDVAREDGYVNACHACYMTRRALLDRFPTLLAPRQMYGVE
jgi:hypothetical protein